MTRARPGKLTHFDTRGAAHMVGVGDKTETERVAIAEATVRMQAATLARVRTGKLGKGDVLGVARLAAIQAVKRTAELIPLCHPVRVVGVEVELGLAARPPRVTIRTTVRAFDRTGVEMEALTAAAVAALTVYDMCKAIDRGIEIDGVRLVEKRGGKSGTWQRTV